MTPNTEEEMGGLVTPDESAQPKDTKSLTEYVTIGTVAIPVKANNARFIPPDVEDGLRYYTNYVRHESLRGFDVLTPPEYLKAIIYQASKGSDYENNYPRIVDELMRYSPTLRNFVEGSDMVATGKEPI